MAARATLKSKPEPGQVFEPLAQRWGLSFMPSHPPEQTFQLLCHAVPMVLSHTLQEQTKES